MAAFEPTRNFSEYHSAPWNGTPIATPSPVLQLPEANLAIGGSLTATIGHIYQRSQPQADAPSLARFVRSMHYEGRLSGDELTHWLNAEPKAGLFHLSYLAAQRLGKRTKIGKAINPDALNKMRGDALYPEDVATLARAGHHLGLYNAKDLSESIAGMDVLTTQFASYWWDCILKANEADDYFKNSYIECEFHSHEDGVFVALTTPDINVSKITIPGDDLPESTLVRDTLIGLIEGLMCATEGLTPADTLGCELYLFENADECHALMGGDSFTGPELIAHMEKQLNVCFSTDADAARDAIVEEFEDFFSLIMTRSLKDWADVMGILSQQNHWLRRTFRDFIPTREESDENGYVENLKAIHGYCKDMVEALKQQHGDDYPLTIQVAYKILAIIEHRQREGVVQRSDWDYDAMQEAEPLPISLRAYFNVRGGDEAGAINSIFDFHLPELDNDRFNSGIEYGEAFMVSKHEEIDSSNALQRFIRDYSECAAVLEQLAEATNKEV